MKYDELLQKYIILEEENRVLKDEIARLKMLLPEEASLSVQELGVSVEFEYTHAVPEKASEKAEPILHTMTEAAAENHQYQISSYPVASSFPAVSKNSSNHEKISLFLDLFKGRSDVCAKRWKNKPGYSPYCYNDFKPGVCQKPRIKCAKCDNSAFAPLLGTIGQ